MTRPNLKMSAAGDPAPAAAPASVRSAAGRPGSVPPPTSEPGTYTPAGGASSANAEGTNAPPDRTRAWSLELPAGMELLSLNGREHWAARHRKTQALKDATIILARKQKIPRLERVLVIAELQPPDRRRRDADNPVPSAKACIDGLVAAGCLPDDSAQYVTSVAGTIGPVHPRGRLVLHLIEVEA